MRNEILNRVLRIACDNIKNADLTIEQSEEDLSSLGMDSISFIQIVVNLEEEFDIEIPDEYLLLTRTNTMSKMADVVLSVLNNEDNMIGE